jgi:hypothetical protein
VLWYSRIAFRENVYILYGMATSASLLTKVDTAIEGLLDALANDAMTEYSVQGRSYKRAEFDTLLKSLMDTRDRLTRQIAGASNRVRVVRLGYTGRSS